MNPLVSSLHAEDSAFRSHLHVIALTFAALLSSAAGAFAATPASVTLGWNANPEANIQRYELHYGTTPGVRPITLDAGANLSAAVPGLNPGTTYYFTVVARNTFGLVSAPSTELIYTVPGTPNSAPVANAAALTVNEDSQTPVTLSATDAEGDALIYTVEEAPTKGTLLGTPPNLTYRAAPNQFGSDTFTFSVFDGVLHSSVVPVNVTITPSNDAPVATARSVTTDEDVSLPITLSGTDPDGDPLAYTILSQPTRGTLTGTGANRIYTPQPNAFGNDSFTFKVSDGTLESDPATVVITVKPVNDPPVATPQNRTTAEDTPLGITLTGTDIEGSALTYTIVGSPWSGTVTGSPPNIVYTPRKDFNGPDSFTFRVSDGTVNSSIAIINVNVTPVNDAPVAISRTVTTPRNTAVAVALTATDADANALTYSLLSSPINGTLTGTPPNFIYTPKTDFTGSDSFTFRANDGTVNSATGTITLAVVNTNRAPQAHARSVSTMLNKVVAVALGGSDPDSNPITFRLISQPANGTLTGTPPNLTYKPKAKWAGIDQFTYVVNDGSVDSAAATVTLKVKKKNLKPVAHPQARTANQNAAFPVQLGGTDPDQDELAFSVVAKPVKGSLSGTPPNLVYTPQAGYRGKDRFTFIVHDGFAKSVAAAVEINVVNPNNRAPVVQSRTLSTNFKAVLSVPLTATDADGDPLTYRITGKPAVGKVTGKLPNLTYKPKKNFTGNVTLTYVANDGTVDSAVATITINVTAPPAVVRRELTGEKTGIDGISPLPSIKLEANPAAPGTLLLHIAGAPGSSYVLETSADTEHWKPERIVTIDVTGSLTETVEIPENSEGGFYRLSEH